MPALIVVAAVIVGVLSWIVRRLRAKRRADVRADVADGVGDRAGVWLVEPELGRLRQIDDTRFAVAILMLQIVRTGSPVTGAERARMLQFLADPLQVGDPAAMLDKAMGQAAVRRAFHLTAGAVLPLLRRRLTRDEQEALLAMLNAVAGVHNPPSARQGAALARFRADLYADPLAPVASL